MTREEWEQPLANLTPQERLQYWLNTSQDLLMRQDTGASWQVQKAQEPPNIRLPSVEEIAANDRSRIALTRLHGLDTFVAELAEKSPLEALQVLEHRFRSDPSESNGLLLQAAINRITTVGSLDAHAEQAVTKAMELFHTEIEQHPGKTDDIWYRAYVDADFQGASVFDSLPPGWVYWRRPDFRGIGMNDMISSLAFDLKTNEVDGNIILFENINFNGRYKSYSARWPNVGYVGDDFNDITSSTLIVRRFQNETRPVSIGSMIPQSAITDIVNQQRAASSAGDATITWDMWPTGSDGHPNEPCKMYIYVTVPIKVSILSIKIGWLPTVSFPDAHAEVRYWINLFVDGQGKLQGHVDYYGCHVSPCCLSVGLFDVYCITDDIKNKLMQKIPDTIGQVNQLVARALSFANIGGPYLFFYFLPGKFQLTGNTSDDVTIVIVRR